MSTYLFALAVAVSACTAALRRHYLLMRNGTLNWRNGASAGAVIALSIAAATLVGTAAAGATTTVIALQALAITAAVIGAAGQVQTYSNASLDTRALAASSTAILCGAWASMAGWGLWLATRALSVSAACTLEGLFAAALTGYVITHYVAHCRYTSRRAITRAS
ncbi:hypothetical protein [Mycobacteroides abscessus]|uniref:hypothetical protein n=1 Tax=Mycobacteroides abscessus TaxID=36809 RepID=UPI0009A77D64|nr:hypothetical protein [Mycobacteroides abscessus]SLH39325.1 Uncharacterised protein [Mycobacteroides abscessus subsp. massiliense]